MHVIYLTVLVLGVLGIAYALSLRERGRLPWRIPSPPTVYCLMITRNLPQRHHYIEASVRNFHEQTHAHKHLVIINQSTRRISPPSAHVTEVTLPEDHALTLGQVRNMSLDFVPFGALWTTWDDDDWRRADYLEALVRELVRHRTDVVTIGDRIEYNSTTRFAHVASLTTGFMTFLAIKHPRLRYGDGDALEDVPLKKYAIGRLRYRVVRLSPTMYVRFAHGDNTSPYVKRRKRKLRDTMGNRHYFERALTSRERRYLADTLREEYARITS